MLDKEPLGLKVLALGINVQMQNKPLLADNTNRQIICKKNGFKIGQP